MEAAWLNLDMYLVKQMIDSLAKNLSFPSSAILKQLLNPLMTDKILKLLGDNGNIFDPLLHNMVNATIVHGGDKVNVIPGEVVVEYDGRLLPGFKQEDMLSELRKLLGTEIEFEVTHYEEGPAKVNMGLFDTLGGIIREYEPEGIPIPFVVSGVTDARFFSKLGIQTYGFTPMLLPKDVNFSRMIHAADERIPVEALGFGTNAIFDLLQKI
jgi:acetylornithine deacetylase/succinyl-diaminopimelate desuccinylase-like protein